MTVETRAPDLALRLSATQRAFVEDQHRWVLMLGGVGAGKSFAGAVKALHRFAAEPRPSLGLVISPTYPMLRDATWRTALDVWAPLISRVVQNEMRVQLVTGHEVLFRSSDDPDRLRGPNAAWAWIDEAALCHADTWPITIGRLRQFGELGRAWLTTTPKGHNWLYDVFVTQATDETAVHRVATWANPFVDAAFTASLRSQYDGEFARQEIEAEWIADQEGTLLEYGWLDAARVRPAVHDPEQPVQAGVDVAGPGEAETVLCIRQGDAILDIRPFPQADARGAVVAALSSWRTLEAVNVDVAGIGHYFAESLQDAGLPVVRINVGEAPAGRSKRETDTAKAKFANLRAQLFWSFREWAAEGMLAGLTDRTALSQLAGLRYAHDHRGRIAIERKEDARKRGVKSPDRAEAVVLAFWSQPRSLLGQALAASLSKPSSIPIPGGTAVVLNSPMPATTPKEPRNAHPIAGDPAFQSMLERFGVRVDG
jgi:phage terminase large subunit-like protein